MKWEYNEANMKISLPSYDLIEICLGIYFK